MKSAVFARFDSSDWCVTACGYKSEWMNSRFRLDRQNLISVWHRNVGLIIGGGHSKYQPDFSLFNVYREGGSVAHLHDKGIVKSLDDGIDLKLWYGEVKVGARIRIVNERKLSITFSCHASDKKLSGMMVRHRLLFASRLGKVLTGGENSVELSENNTLHWTMEDHQNVIVHNGWTLRIPDLENFQTTLNWPLRPFASYRLDAKAAPSAYALSLSGDFRLPHKEVEYVLEV